MTSFSSGKGERKDGEMQPAEKTAAAAPSRGNDGLSPITATGM